MLNQAFTPVGLDEAIKKICSMETGDMKQVWMLMVSLVVLLSMAGCEREKDRLDAEVRRLCAQDGGVKVYEKVLLPPGKFDSGGVVSVPLESNSKPADQFYYEWETTYLKTGNPEMWRNHFRLVRRKDGKLLGEAVSYSRRGGDLPGPWHESSFGCPADGDISVLKHLVFGKLDGGEKE